MGKPFITGPAATSRARPIVAVSSLENTEQPEFITTLTDVGITALRLGTCALMVHHGFDRIQKAHSYNFELAAMYVFVLGYFSVAGAGKYSIDEQVLGGELNFYSGLLDKAFGGEEEE